MTDAHGASPNGRDSAPEIFDITIIGAGPTGLFASFYGGLRGASVQIIDSLEEAGGALTAIYPEKYIYDVIGFPKVLAKDFVAACLEQALRSNPTLRLNEEIYTLERQDDGVIRLTTSAGIRYGRTVVICAGVGAFEPKRIDVPGLRELEGRGVHYFAKRVEDFRGRDVVIVGGGDSAVDWAVTLEPVARNIPSFIALSFARTKRPSERWSNQESICAIQVTKSRKFTQMKPDNLKRFRSRIATTPCIAYPPRS